MDNYKKYMYRCIELAKQGAGNVSPNPLVGCVVLGKEGDVLAEGYHHKYGEAHAERDALLKLKSGEEKDGTLIVNLEPCSHFGKTPPCVDLIIERGLKKVVIGCRDNNPKVHGEGIKRLKDAGNEVIEGILEDECRKLNEVFFTDVEKKRTFVVLKTASTIDGKISTATGDSKWITSEFSRNCSRELRKHYDAILTSSSTVIADNPRMEHKLKIVLDRKLKTDFSSNIYKNGNVIVVCEEGINNISDKLPENVTLMNCKVSDNKFDLDDLLSKLYDLKIKSVFVEAGGKLLGSFIKGGYADKIYHFIAPKIINDNSGKSCFDGDSIKSISELNEFVLEDIKRIGPDVLLVYGNKNDVE